MSTQVSSKQWRSTLHLVTNAQAPYLSEGYVPALIILRMALLRSKGRTQALPRTHGG